MRKTVGFLLSVAVMMAVLPAYNLCRLASKEDAAPSQDWWVADSLFNIDDLIGWVSHKLYLVGISTAPKQVYVGKEGWLFLGDRYERTVSVRRDGPPKAYDERALRIVEAQVAWDRWLREHGVLFFQTIIGPNKSSVYSEYLPDWVGSTRGTLAEAVMSIERAEDHIYDPTSFLKTSGRTSAVQLYYSTDTHWTPTGAQLATEEFLQRAKSRLPGIEVPVLDTDLLLSSTRSGDLAAFLHMGERIDERVLEPTISHPKVVDTSQEILETGKSIGQGGNPMVGNQAEPLLVRSEGALNEKKVLWLRDSFGTSMSPYIGATFSDVVQTHWSKALENDAQLFVKLVEQWEPDIVLITVVERSLISKLLATLPPR